MCKCIDAEPVRANSGILLAGPAAEKCQPPVYNFNQNSFRNSQNLGLTGHICFQKSTCLVFVVEQHCRTDATEVFFSPTF